ncbi:hypothetical protein M0804_007198 [Polistes exclamans]|nr:hypothetical protein M0804_007198 [Polistes exclamans]
MKEETPSCGVWILQLFHVVIVELVSVYIVVIIVIVVVVVCLFLTFLTTKPKVKGLVKLNCGSPSDHRSQAALLTIRR